MYRKTKSVVMMPPPILLLQIYMIPYIVIGRRVMIINGGLKGAIR